MMTTPFRTDLEIGDTAAFPWLEQALAMRRDGVDPLGSIRDLQIWMLRELSRSVPVNVAWCGLVVGTALHRAGIADRAPFPEVRARPWLGFGQACEPQMGAIMVFWTIHPCSPFGHVGFCVGQDAGAYHILGGNQYDSIDIARWPRKRLLDCRWPLHGPAPAGIVRRCTSEQALPFQYERLDEGMARIRRMLARHAVFPGRRQTPDP